MKDTLSRKIIDGESNKKQEKTKASLFKRFSDEASVIADYEGFEKRTLLWLSFTYLIMPFVSLAVTYFLFYDIVILNLSQIDAFLTFILLAVIFVLGSSYVFSVLLGIPYYGSTKYIRW